MLDDNPNDATNTVESTDSPAAEATTPAPPVVKRTTRKSAPRKTAVTRTPEPAESPAPEAVTTQPAPAESAVETPAAPTVKKTTRTRTSPARKSAAAPADSVQDALLPDAGDAVGFFLNGEADEKAFNGMLGFGVVAHQG